MLPLFRGTLGKGGAFPGRACPVAAIRDSRDGRPTAVLRSSLHIEADRIALVAAGENPPWAKATGAQLADDKPFVIKTVIKPDFLNSDFLYSRSKPPFCTAYFNKIDPVGEPSVVLPEI